VPDVVVEPPVAVPPVIPPMKPPLPVVVGTPPVAVVV
jgi:hypothetical protein